MTFCFLFFFCLKMSWFLLEILRQSKVVSHLVSILLTDPLSLSLVCLLLSPWCHMSPDLQKTQVCSPEPTWTLFFQPSMLYLGTSFHIYTCICSLCPVLITYCCPNHLSVALIHEYHIMLYLKISLPISSKTWVYILVPTLLQLAALFLGLSFSQFTLSCCT